MEERNQNPRSKMSDCFFHLDMTVLAILSVILTGHILNLSGYDLPETESFVLSHGLNFGLPPRYLCKEQIFAKFESL